MHSLNSLQTSSVRLRRLLTVLLAALAVLLILERFGAIGLRLFREGPSTAALDRLAFEFVIAFPEFLYLIALFWTRQALAGFATGDLWSPTIIRMLNRVGGTLAMGAAITVFLVPGLSAAVGFGPGYFIALDVSSLVLGAIGLSLKIIAHILAEAAAAKAELDQIL